jgi:hypothetical protein
LKKRSLAKNSQQFFPNIAEGKFGIFQFYDCVVPRMAKEIEYCILEECLPRGHRTFYRLSFSFEYKPLGVNRLQGVQRNRKTFTRGVGHYETQLRIYGALCPYGDPELYTQNDYYDIHLVSAHDNTNEEKEARIMANTRAGGKTMKKKERKLLLLKFKLDFIFIILLLSGKTNIAKQG